MGHSYFSTETRREQAELDSEHIGIRTKKPAGIQLLHNEIAKLREDSTIRALPDVIGYWELLRNAFFSSFLVLQCIIVYHSVSTIIHYLSEE